MKEENQIFVPLLFSITGVFIVVLLNFVNSVLPHMFKLSNIETVVSLFFILFLGFYLINKIIRKSIYSDNKQEEIKLLKDNEKFRKEFIGNVSHELKTPAFNVQGYVYTLINGGIEDNEINLKYLKRTQKNIDRLISVINDLDTIASLERGSFILNIEKFDIVQLVREVFEMLHLKSEESKTMLSLNSSVEKCSVKADRDKIFEVVLNLVSNAVRYGKVGGMVLVTIREMPEKVYVDVADDGIGIEKENLSRIFERFFRVDKSRSKDSGGTGLGLSIVKHIIEKHNSEIAVKSEFGKGTVFTFFLAKPEK